jgi:hypothetical protein
MCGYVTLGDQQGADLGTIDYLPYLTTGGQRQQLTPETDPQYRQPAGNRAGKQ